MSIPFLWSFADISGSWLAAGRYDEAAAIFLEGLVYWFLCAPIIVDFGLFLTRTFCRKATCMAYEIMKNIAILWLATLGLGAMAGSIILVHLFYLGQDPLERAAVIAFSWGMVAMFHILMLFSFRSQRMICGCPSAQPAIIRIQRSERDAI